MAQDVEKPRVKNLDKMLEYLDQLRESGETNMFAAAPYLERYVYQELGQRMFTGTARKVLVYWMRTFGERHAHT